MSNFLIPSPRGSPPTCNFGLFYSCLLLCWPYLLCLSSSLNNETGVSSSIPTQRGSPLPPLNFGVFYSRTLAQKNGRCRFVYKPDFFPLGVPVQFWKTNHQSGIWNDGTPSVSSSMLWLSYRFMEFTVLCTKISILNHAFANTCVSIQKPEWDFLH